MEKQHENVFIERNVTKLNGEKHWRNEEKQLKQKEKSKINKMVVINLDIFFCLCSLVWGGNDDNDEDVNGEEREIKTGTKYSIKTLQ